MSNLSTHVVHHVCLLSEVMNGQHGYFNYLHGDWFSIVIIHMFSYKVQNFREQASDSDASVYTPLRVIAVNLKLLLLSLLNTAHTKARLTLIRAQKPDGVQTEAGVRLTLLCLLLS